MQTGTSDWLALDVSELFFFFFPSVPELNDVTQFHVKEN